MHTGWDINSAAKAGRPKRRATAAACRRAPAAPAGTASGSGGERSPQPALLVEPPPAPLPRSWAPDPAVLALAGATPLLLAAAAGADACVAWLLENGADALLADGCGASPYAVAAAAGQLGAFRALLPAIEAGAIDGSAASLSAVDAAGRSLLHAAAFGGDDALLRLLIETAGLNPAAAAPSSADGRGCLHHCAAGAGSCHVAQRLLAAGCSAEARDAAGALPYHLAAEKVGAAFNA